MKMKTNFFLLLLLCLGVSAQAQQYDVIIVGGGIAGLAAAEQLNDQKVLLLEKESRLGGRVQSRKFESVYYELGAYSAYPKSMLEFEFEPSTLIPGSDSIGMLLNGKVMFCAAPLECMYKAGFSVPEIEKLKNYDEKNGINFSGMPEWKVKVINSFFNIVQSGDIRQYNPKRQLDAFKTWTTDHYRYGNSELVYELRSRFEGDVALNALVTSVEQKTNFAEVTYEEEGKKKTVTARAVLVTTPAPIAQYLVKDLPEQVNKALSDIAFNQHSVSVVITKNDNLPAFNYITTPELYSSTIIQSKTAEKDIRVYYIHYSNKKSELIKGWKKTKLEDKSKEILSQLFPKEFNPESVVHFDHSYWRQAATTVSPDYYNNWNKQIFNPLPSIYFAGDWMDPFGFPLGIYAAYTSGVRASKLIQTKLNP